MMQPASAAEDLFHLRGFRRFYAGVVVVMALALLASAGYYYGFYVDLPEAVVSSEP